jgi:pimeloyl-ACP methyl ester carboxylesterase
LESKIKNKEYEMPITGTSKYVTANGLQLHYLEWGKQDSPIVILLHGLRGHAHSWDEVSAALQEKYHVFAIDQRGRGLSEWDPNSNYSTEAYAEDLVQFTKALSIDRFTLIGHSMGGRNALMYASQHSDKLSKLGIIDIGPKLDSIGSKRIGDEMATGPTSFIDIQEVVDHLKTNSKYATVETLTRRAIYATKQDETGHFIWSYDPAIRSQRKTGATESAANPPDLWPLVSNISCPTLVFRGMQSDILTEEVATKMTQIIPDCNTVAINNATHTVFEDNPCDFITELKGFLS